MGRQKQNKEYAVYRGEDVISIGTIDEIAEHLKIKRSSVQFWLSPAYRKRINSRQDGLVVAIEMVLIEDEEDEE